MHARNLLLSNLLGEPPHPHKLFLVSALEEAPCFGFFSLLRLVGLKPANPFRMNTNLCRLEVTKMPPQMQSVCYPISF